LKDHKPCFPHQHEITPRPTPLHNKLNYCRKPAIATVRSGSHFLFFDFASFFGGLVQAILMAEKPVPVNNMPLPKLQELIADVEMRCEQLADAVAQLNGALNRYEEIGSSLHHLGVNANGRQLMVPLSESMYAMGEMVDGEKVLVDIGTGFFVEKTMEDAKNFVERKKDYVKKQIAGLDLQLDTQTRNLEQLTLVIQAKQQQGQKK
jgi:prefoldin alpha subunit